MRRIISFIKLPKIVLSGNKELFVSQDRYEGYKEASKSRDSSRWKNWFISFGFMLKTIYQMMESLP